MPAELASATATVGSTIWMVVGQILFVQGLGFLQVASVLTSTTVSLKNLEDAATAAYAGNAAAGTVAGINSKVSPAGTQGPIGSTAGAAGGDLKGTYPNPRLVIPNAKGSIIVGDGTNAAQVAGGADGTMLVNDTASFANNAGWKQIIPKTADTNVADNRVGRLDGAVGLPIPIQSSKLEITDNGAVRAVGSGGNARGTDAVDLQVVPGGRTTQVASGTESVIAGGSNNTASGSRAVVAGGHDNIASQTDSAVLGGGSNQATAQYATVGGGTSNIATSRGSTIAGGEINTAQTNPRAFIGGGQSNFASGLESVIGGGNANNVSAVGTQATISGGLTNSAVGVLSAIGGGGSNSATGLSSTVGGGQSNSVTNSFATVPGGFQALADKYGQVSHASGRFAADGDAQVSEVTFRRSTTDATANVEMFLNGDSITERCSIPNNKSIGFQGVIIGRTSAGVSSMWTFVGGIDNNAGATAATGITVTLVYNTIVAGTPSVDADNANDALRIRVTGVAATLIRWVAYVRLVEVGY